MTGKKPSNSKPIDKDIEERAADFRDPEIEYQLLAYGIRENPSVLGMVEKLWFSDILLQDVFDVASDLRIVLSRAMILNELKSRGLMSQKERGLFEEALDQLFEVNVAPINEKTVRHMMSQLLNLYESRRVLKACGQVIGTIRQFDLQSAKTKLLSVAREARLNDTENTVDYLEHYDRRVEVMREKEQAVDASEDGEVGIHTGIPMFDRLTGGLMPKEFGVILGVTGVGKTAGLIEFAANAWEHGHNVFVGSGEMSIEELAFRVDARLTRIPGMKFRTAELSEEDYKKWENTIIQYRAMKDNRFYIASYPRRFTIDDLDRDMTRIEEETGEKLGAVFLDYINIVDPVTRGRSDAKDQSEAVWDFKGLCSDRNIGGWTAGQVRDDAYDKELYDAQDAKYARAISEAAPVIIALIQTDKDLVEGRMKLQVIKMRNADVPTRPIRLTPNLSIMRLHEEVKKTASLADLKDNVVEMERKARKTKPKPRQRRKS